MTSGPSEADGEVGDCADDRDIARNFGVNARSTYGAKHGAKDGAKHGAKYGANAAF